MRSWAAEAFFCELPLPGVSSFFCCFSENNLIMIDEGLGKGARESPEKIEKKGENLLVDVFADQPNGLRPLI